MRHPDTLPKVLLSTLTAASMLSACVHQKAPITPFDPAKTSWSTQAGPNVIAGVAHLATADGGMRSCASLPVRLAPDSIYTRQRVALLYGGTISSFVNAKEAHRVRGKPGAKVDKAYARSLKASVCDLQGRFTFKNLPDGTYFVMAPVVWGNRQGDVNEGGYFMQRITVSGGETRRISMTL
jgi:hypothetical protein